MSRNLYILAGTLGFFSFAAVVVSFTNVAQQPGSPGDAALWRTMGIAFLVFALLATLAGVFSDLFEQAERRADGSRIDRKSKWDKT